LWKANCNPIGSGDWCGGDNTASDADCVGGAPVCLERERGHTVKKKHIPKRWSREYNSVSALPRLPETPLHALKTAIEEIGALEIERDRLLEDSSLLNTSLKDLQDCRKDYLKLLHRKYDLRDALQKCQEQLSKLISEQEH
jgi:hypothetical protein